MVTNMKNIFVIIIAVFLFLPSPFKNIKLTEGITKT